ncbi:MAG: hypothetical protein HC842_02135 [Cytophagales bacterium]|nr:hypothetical protein [Cytophagales bacterium]
MVSNPYLRLSPGAVVLDVGANVGLMSLGFAQNEMVDTVYSFEPTHYAKGPPGGKLTT